MIHPTLERLHELRLSGMAAALVEQLQSSTASELSFEERLALLLEREVSVRDNRRLQRLLQEARLRLPGASLEDIDFRSSRGLDRSVLLRLSSADWIRQHQVVLLVGPTGAGKSYLACALAQSGCRNGLSTRYFRLGRLLSELLILDEWGLAPLGDTERRDLLEILEDRHRSKATVVTSQLPIEHWHDDIGNPTLADAILDRIVHGGHKITLKGGSMRKRLADRESEPPLA